MTEAALYYEAAIPGFGDIFLDDIRHAIDAVRERPEIGAKVAYGFRRVLVRRFPFSIIYAVEAEAIVVVAVSQSAASPRVLERAQMTANTTFERTVDHRGPRLTVARRWWPGVQLGR